MLSDRDFFIGMGVSVVYTEEEVDDDVEPEEEDDDDDDDEDDDELVLLPEEPMVTELRRVCVKNESMQGLVIFLWNGHFWYFQSRGQSSLISPPSTSSTDTQGNRPVTKSPHAAQTI
jgi:hypothetical protein